MSQKFSSAGKRSGNNYAEHGATMSLKVLVPTKCRDNTIQEIYSFLSLLKGRINVDFLHIVPISPEEFCDCVNISDVDYDRAVAEKKLFSFVRKFPESENMIYDYKIANGDPKSAIESLVDEGSYDMVALEIGEFCHFANSIFDISEIISTVNIPVITFGNASVNRRIGTGDIMMEAIS